MVRLNYHEDVFAEGETHYGVLQTYLLSQLDLSSIAQSIEKQYYSPIVNVRFHYRVELLLKLWIFMRYHKKTYRTVISSLTDEDLANLLTKEELEKFHQGKFSLPSPSTLHHFVVYRLKDEGIAHVSSLLGTAMMHHLKNNTSTPDGDEGIVDSTPLEASRYSPYATFNPHYKMWMAKAHIVSTAGYPLFMIFSEGAEDDGKYGHLLVNEVKKMNPEFKSFLCDGGYDSFLMYAEIFGELGARPIIRIRDTAVIHPEASDERLRKVANSQWKKGGDGKASIQDIRKFLYTLPVSDTKNPDKYKELVGINLRNENLEIISEIDEALDKRGRCEEMHSQLKDIFKFNVKRCHKDHRALYVMLDFIAAQSMLLAYLQNNSSKKSLAGFI